ncbi:MAG: VWA domain-containing protein [Oscillospiraceae bacterium]|nr:VWA domain-containing protein [Oscillospiraceae bacterium]
MELVRGMRAKLGDHFDLSRELQVEMSISGSAVYDHTCFGVDSNDILSDDRYMVFYNQTSSPAGEIKYTAKGNAAVFTVKLDALPASVAKLVFTVSVDGDGVMGDIAAHSVVVSQSGREPVRMDVSGKDFKAEKAIISIEIYKKGEWRIAAAAKGMNGGLSALLASFGGTEADDDVPAAAPAPAPGAPTPVPVAGASAPAPSKGVSLKKTEAQVTEKIMSKISLSKDKVKLEKHVVNLSKCVVSLSKTTRIDLGDMRAKVVVVIDYSGSMGSLYRTGVVQETLDRLVPLGLTFDDNGSLDVFLFQSDYRRMEPLGLSNYANYVRDVIISSDYPMGGTKYAPVLSIIIEGGETASKGGLFGKTKATVIPPIVDDGAPTFILFITDGDNADKPETDRIIRKCSDMNVFIQFIGIGTERFDYLRSLDDMQGRKRDNTGFSCMKDLKKASDDELYRNVLSQFSDWLDHLQ